MWSKISNALKPREGNDADLDHSDAQSTAHSPPPDPFCANATTYYTQQAPPTPPSGAHSRTASREEDIIWSLRTQLALQQELCAQFEIDLGARDELVQALTIRLEGSEKENDKRRNVIRSWKKKAAELEKMCRHLEEEVDNSRQESLERTIMDAASGEALRQLHRQISQLERERNDVKAERDSLTRAVENSEAVIIELKEKLGATDEASGETVRRLHDQVSRLEREKNDVEGERNALAQGVERAEAVVAMLRGELSVTDEASVEALRQLHSQISQLEQQKNDLQIERDTLAQAREKASVEALKLQEELDTTSETNREALQRLHEQISRLEREKGEIKVEHDNLVQASDETHHQLRDQVSQLQQERDDIETERDKEISRLRVHIQQLQKDSAAMEVTIVQLNKQLDQNKEDVDGLNIALESKQQELELIKRKHGARGTVGPTANRTNVVPSTAGKPTLAAGPSALGRTVNTRPTVAGALRRASTSGIESKAKFTSRRVSITSVSEADGKENTSTPVPSRSSRRAMVPA